MITSEVVSSDNHIEHKLGEGYKALDILHQRVNHMPYLDLRFSMMMAGEAKGVAFESYDAADGWLQDMTSEVTGKPESAHRTFWLSRLDGSRAYFDGLRRRDKGEEQIPIDEFVERVAGVNLHLIPHQELEGRRKELVDQFWELGYAFNRNGWQRFYDIEGIQGSPKEIMQARMVNFKAVERAITPIILSVLGRGVNIAAYEEKFENVNMPRSISVKGGPEVYEMVVNENPVNVHRWFRGSEEAFATHEYGAHVLQALVLRDLVLAGKIPEAAFATIPGVEQAGAEGIAQTVVYLLPQLQDKLTPYGRFAIDFSNHRYEVFNQLLILANNGERESVMREFVQHHVPNETDESFDRILRFYREDPRYRGYHPDYAEGLRLLRWAAENLDAVDRADLLRYNYFGLHTYTQEQGFIQSLPSYPGKRAA